MKKLHYLLPVICLLFLASCAPRIVGTWNVEKLDSMVPGQVGTTLTNIGTITFNKDMSGNKDIHYTVFGVPRDNTSAFTWSYTKAYLTIKTDDSLFAKTWLLVSDKKNTQRFQATNGNNEIQTMELKRKK